MKKSKLEKEVDRVCTNLNISPHDFWDTYFYIQRNFVGPLNVFYRHGDIEPSTVAIVACLRAKHRKPRLGLEVIRP